MSENLWLALEIGNSRLHWALFAGERISKTWDSDHLCAETLKQLPEGTLGGSPPILVASVVPSQTEIWQTYYQVRVLKLTPSTDKRHVSHLGN